MAHHSLLQYSLIHLVVLAILLVPKIHTQTTITEESLLTPLNVVVDANVYRGANDRLHIVGTAEGYYSPPSYWNGFRLLFLMSRDPSGATSTTTFSDTAWFWTDGLHGEEYRFNRSAAVTTQDNVVLFWSKQHATLGDLPPYTRLSLPSGKCIKQTLGGVVDLFDLPRSTSPALDVGQDNITHFVWETIRSVRSDSNCIAYSSRVFYRYLSAAGQLSASQFIDTGFSPRVASKSTGSSHIAWLRADSSTASQFALRYRTIDNGVPGPTVTLKESLHKPANFALSSDLSGIVYIAWTEPRPGSKIKIFILTYTGFTTTIDSSRSYSDLPINFRLNVAPTGVVHAAWVTSMGGADTLYYTGTRTGSPFVNVRAFTNSAFRFGETLALFTKSNSHPGCVWGSSNRMRYLSDVEYGSDSALVFLDGRFFPGSTRPVTVDRSDNLWVVYRKSASYQLWLARFVDQTTDVSRKNSIPLLFNLNQNYPNPFNPSTTIKYDLPEPAKVSLIIYDVLGRKVAELVNEQKAAGYHSVTWNAANVASGVYLARFTASDANGYSKYSRVNKLVLIK